MHAGLENRLHQPWFGGGVGALLAALAGLVLFLFPLGNGLRNLSFDLPFLFRPEIKNNNAVIVFLDEKSYAELGQSPAAFDRRLHAQLLNRLKAAGAKMVVFDILFLDANRSTPAADRELATAMTNAGPVVIGAKLYQDTYEESVLADDSPSVWAPLDIFRNAAAGWGLAEVRRDPDFSVRMIYPGTDRVPSLAWKAAEISDARVTHERDHRRRERWLNYYSSKPFNSVSLSDVLSEKPLPANISFKDKVVFVGSGEVAGYTGQEKEQYRYPWSWVNGYFPCGVEIHALEYTNYVQGDWLTRVPGALQTLLFILTGILFGYGLSCFRPLPATGLAIGGVLITTTLAVIAANLLHIWVSWLIIVAVQIPIALGWAYLFNSIKSYVQMRLLETSLALYLSPESVKQILKRPDLLKPGAELKTVSIVFSDIAGFSKVSERMHVEDLVKLMNVYYETAIACVHETRGTVMNLIGDAIFAIWNAPQEQPDHQLRACKAAILLNQALIKFESGSVHLPLNTRVGLHTGAVCVGNIGSSTHFDYTAIGESVNLASRLEGLNKQLGTNILATRDIQKSVEGQIVSRLVGHFKFKGFDQVVEVHEMVALPDQEQATAAWRNAFAAALNRFQRKSFAEAEAGFRKTLELRPDDGPSKFYLEQIKRLSAQPPAAEWFGEIDLREK